MRRYYFAHPFGSRAIIRQKELEWESRYDIEIVNPFSDLSRNDVVALDEGRITRRQLDHHLIVNRDLVAIQSCDAMIAYIDGSPSKGTPMEIFYAWQFHKPVYLIVTDGDQDHSWLIVTCEEIYLSFDEFEEDELR